MLAAGSAGREGWATAFKVCTRGGVVAGRFGWGGLWLERLGEGGVGRGGQDFGCGHFGRINGFLAFGASVSNETLGV